MRIHLLLAIAALQCIEANPLEYIDENQIENIDENQIENIDENQIENIDENPAAPALSQLFNATDDEKDLSNLDSTACHCGQANKRRRRRSDGTGNITNLGGVAVNEYPWQVALVKKDSNNVFCGGSLINDRWVLTAAHCVPSGEADQVLLGNHFQLSTESTEMRRNIRRTVNHPNYNPRTMNNDFSLLELSTPIDLDLAAPDIRPVCLPSASNPSQYENVPAIVTGWGTQSSGGVLPNALREVTVKTMTNAGCNQNYGGTITDSMICAAASGRDACQGDSGGPLVTNVGGHYDLIGVVSWGAGCAHPEYPGVYARVSYVLDWINSYTSGSKTCPK